MKNSLKYLVTLTTLMSSNLVRAGVLEAEIDHLGQVKVYADTLRNQLTTRNVEDPEKKILVVFDWDRTVSKEEGEINPNRLSESQEMTDELLLDEDQEEGIEYTYPTTTQLFTHLTKEGFQPIILTARGQGTLYAPSAFTPYVKSMREAAGLTSSSPMTPEIIPDSSTGIPSDTVKYLVQNPSIPINGNQPTELSDNEHLLSDSAPAYVRSVTNDKQSPKLVGKSSLSDSAPSAITSEFDSFIDRTPKKVTYENEKGRQEREIAAVTSHVIFAGSKTPTLKATTLARLIDSNAFKTHPLYIIFVDNSYRHIKGFSEVFKNRPEMVYALYYPKHGDEEQVLSSSSSESSGSEDEQQTSSSNSSESDE